MNAALCSHRDRGNPTKLAIRFLSTVLALIVLLASAGYSIAREGGTTRRAAALIFLVAWLAVAAFPQMGAPSPEPVRSFLGAAAIVWIPFVATGWMHMALEDDPWSPLQRTAAAGAVGVLTIPLVWILALFLSCTLEGPCL